MSAVLGKTQSSALKREQLRLRHLAMRLGSTASPFRQPTPAMRESPMNRIVRRGLPEAAAASEADLAPSPTTIPSWMAADTG